MKAFAATRRGRPKTQQNGHDLGTPELQALRHRLVAGADPVLAENPLGILLARGLISAEQHGAGCRYERLYRQAVARREISFGQIYRRLGEATGRSTGGECHGADDARMAEARRQYLAAKANLLQAGPAAARAVEALVVFGEWPDVSPGSGVQTRFDNDNLSRAAIRKIMQIRSGLDALLKGLEENRHT
ncbi:MAG TPA: hypothetical protein VGM59_02895 [Dongiaceae bacterium]|jgi:hypothetical protein